jgi:hypothetical protein
VRGPFLAACLVVLTAGCYSPVQPACGFSCARTGNCPEDYFCAADGICHRQGTPSTLTCAADASIDTPRPIDAPPADADLTPPAVFATMPASGATGVPLDTVVRVQFTEPVVGVTTGTFYLESNSASIPGTVMVIDPLDYTFTPTSQLPANATIDVTLTSGIADAAGNPLVPTTFSFQTGS